MDKVEKKLTDNMQASHLSPPISSPLAMPVERGDRVEEIGVFGAMTGEKGTVIVADADQAIVKWDDDGRELLRQRYLTKTYPAA